MAKKVNIIGAGIAGLCTGCYLQMNGYDTEIFELHTVPGGLCTSWKRKEYTIDLCIHWLVGSNPNNNIYHIWNELIDMKKMKFVNHEEFFQVEDHEGACIQVFTDINRLKAEMLKKAPEDREMILEFTHAVRKLTKFSMSIDKARETYTLIDALKMMWKLLPYLGFFRKWRSISAQEYANRCKNPLMKRTFEFMFAPDMSILFLIMTLAWMHNKNAGYPIGGSLNFARQIEKKYRDSGGRIHYGSRVTKILTENNTVCGIQLEDGTMRHSDIVVSAADGYCTIFEMLEGKYTDDTIRDYYNNYQTYPSFVQISLGVARTFENVPNSLYFPLETPFMNDSTSHHDYCFIRVFNFDPTMAPEGKTVLTTKFPTENFQYWCDLRANDREKYRAEKDRIAKDTIKILDRKFGNITSYVELVDVSTPATLIRYTNNWKGSYCGWIMTPPNVLKQMKKTLPGLSNFYMAGHWVMLGGGLPPAIMSGRDVAKIICKKDKKTFTSS